MASKNSSSSGLLSKRYAIALYELATESGYVDPLIKNLNTILDHKKNNKDFSLLLDSPLIASDDKLNIID